MALPTRPLPTASVEVYGQPVEVRALSRSEALHVNTGFTKETADQAEVYILARGAGISEDEAREWLGQNEVAEAGKLVDKILALTGLLEDGEEAPKDSSA